MAVAEQFIPMPQARRITGLSDQTLRAWARSGRLPGENLGGRLWIFPKEAIDEIVATRTAKE